MGYTIFQGNCFETDRVIPFAPMLNLIQTLISESLIETLKPFAPELMKLMPEISNHFSNVKPSLPLEPELEKRRYFQTFSSILNRPEQLPLLIIIEDLHWCDETSLELLLTMIRSILSKPILFLLTYRNDETYKPLEHFLAEIDRTHLAVEINLNHLTLENVNEMMKSIFSQREPIRPEFSQTIYTLTDGNPFFVEEILKSLVATGEIFTADGIRWSRKPISELKIPRTVQDAVQKRIQQLSEPAQELLNLASVLGRRFSFFFIKLITKKHEPELFRLINELKFAQLLIEERNDTFAFRHALTHQAIYTSLLGREKRNLHQSIAELLESFTNQSAYHASVEELSFHFYQAGVWEKAFEYSHKAAEHARTLYTPRAAIEHLSRAIESAHYISETLPLNLYRARAEQFETLGDFTSAEKDFQIVLDEARTHKDKKTEWQALIDLGFLYASFDYAKTGDLFQQAFVVGQALGDDETLGHTMNRIGNWHLNIDKSKEALHYHTAALKIFEGLKDKRGIAATHDLLGITYFSSNDVYKSFEHYQKAIDIFRELDERGGLASSLTISSSRGNDYIAGTAIPLSVSLAQRLGSLNEALSLAQETDAKPAEALIKIWNGMLLNSAGKYEGFNDLQVGLTIAESIGHKHFQAVARMILGMSYIDILSPKYALDELEQALQLSQVTNSMIWISLITAHMAMAHLQMSDFCVLNLCWQQN
ncbi:MAG: AAA family ATPase [Anaerolineales bacterium]|nr:AAA family ATPase [Anaerolineales bacterium]